jgi:hypothetical protein
MTPPLTVVARLKRRSVPAFGVRGVWSGIIEGS